MRPGLSSHLLRPYPVRAAIEAAQRLRYAGVEVWSEHLWEQGESPEALGRLARAQGLELTVHGPILDVNVTSRNPGIREASQRQYHRALGDAARLGARLVVFHPGRFSSALDTLEQHWPESVAIFGALGRAAARDGIVIGIEHMEARERQYLTHPQEVIRLVQAADAPALGLTLDLAHLAVSGQALMLDDIAPYLKHVHASGSTTTKTHVPLAESTVDVGPVFRELARRYDGLVVIEGYTPGRKLATVESNRRAFDILVAGTGRPASGPGSGAAR